MIKLEARVDEDKKVFVELFSLVLCESCSVGTQVGVSDTMLMDDKKTLLSKSLSTDFLQVKVEECIDLAH